MREILDAFYKSGLAKEFFETLINDASIPERLRRSVWMMISTEWPRKQECINTFADTFARSTDELDLTELWRFHVDQLWPDVPSCPLRDELERLPRFLFKPE